MRKTIENIRSIAVAAAVIVVILLAVWIYRALSDARLEVGADNSIGLTPTQIESIKAVGEWEFLSISTEELVDTVRRSLLRRDELARIYYGTLRLGFNMKDVEISTQGDSVLLTLPRIGLLDRDFIDEARTKAFHESGTWTARDREALYQKARRQMLRHALTPANIKTAQDNADVQMRRMMTALGYEKVTIKRE